MARSGHTSPLHWVGVLFLLVAWVLLLVTTISSPVINDIGILKVTLRNQTHIRHSSLTFGTFGHCALDVPPVTSDQDYCAKKTVGYKPAILMSEADGTQFSHAAQDTADGLTGAMILHPIACVLAFLAFLFSIGAGVVGSLLGASVAALAWVLTLIVMAIDFTLFGIIKNHVNDHSGVSGSHAFYSSGMWCVLSAMIFLFFGMFIVLFTCFSSRKAKKSGHTTTYKTETHGNGSVGHKKKRFGLF